MDNDSLMQQKSMARPSLPPASTYQVDLTNDQTELIVAHKFGFIPNGAIVFSHFEFIAGLDEPGWQEVRAFQAGEWKSVRRIAAPRVASDLFVQ